MSTYDFYIENRCGTKGEINKIVLDTTMDEYSRIRILACALGSEAETIARVGDRDHAGYKSLLSKKRNGDNQFTEGFIEPQLQIMEDLKLLPALQIPLNFLPPYSVVIQFDFTLARPLLSRDDQFFYIIENSLRKEKVFKVPMIGAASWKGNLRWSAMKTDLHAALNDLIAFSNKRLRHTLLFGSEKGLEAEGSWKKYLDHCCPDDLKHYEECSGK
jgi:CRISPR-associated protein Cmr2